MWVMTGEDYLCKSRSQRMGCDVIGLAALRIASEHRAIQVRRSDGAERWDEGAGS